MHKLNQRLFFALWPSHSTRTALAEAQQLLKPSFKAQWVNPNNLHITLAFLGSVEAEKVALANAAADAVGGRPFELLLDCIDYWRKPRILCLTAGTTPTELEQLAGDLAGNLRAAGFELDKRPFRAHLTLARKAPYLPLADARLEWAIPWKSTAFVLVESIKGPDGSRYSVIKSWELKQGKTTKT